MMLFTGFGKSGKSLLVDTIYSEKKGNVISEDYAYFVDDYIIGYKKSRGIRLKKNWNNIISSKKYKNHSIINFLLFKLVDNKSKFGRRVFSWSDIYDTNTSFEQTNEIKKYIFFIHKLKNVNRYTASTSFDFSVQCTDMMIQELNSIPMFSIYFSAINSIYNYIDFDTIYYGFMNNYYYIFGKYECYNLYIPEFENSGAYIEYLNSFLQNI